VLTGTVPFGPDAFLTYRRLAVGAAGYGLPAFLYGVVAVAGGGRREVGAALVGGVLSTFAVVLFLTARSGWLAVLDAPVYAAAALVVYALGSTLGGAGAVGAMLLEAEPEGHEDGTGIEIEAASEFIWGEPPEK
jgi:hypothetical protein